MNLVENINSISSERYSGMSIQHVHNRSNRTRSLFHETLRETIAATSINEGRNDRNVPHNQRLWNACIEMESIFVARMLKEMRNTLHPEMRLLYGGQAEEIFTDMLYDQYALIMSRTSNFGIARMLYQELSNMR